MGRIKEAMYGEELADGCGGQALYHHVRLFAKTFFAQYPSQQFYFRQPILLKHCRYENMLKSN